MRKLKVNLDDLIQALENDFHEHSYFLDLQTGEVVMLTDDINSLLDDLPDTDKEDEESQRQEFLEWLKGVDCPEWEKEFLPLAYEIEYGDRERYLTIPFKESSREGYQTMVDFAETVEDNRLQEILWVALNGKGAFRRFKDVLYGYTEEQKRWYAFQNQRQREAAVEWLEENDVELIEE